MNYPSVNATMIIQPIVEQFKNFSIRKLFLSFSIKNIEFHKQMLELYSHQFEEVYIIQNFLEPKRFQSVIVSNFTFIKIWEYIPLKINDLLASNSSTICMGYQVPPKDICTFLKHWIHGSNEQLKQLIMMFPLSFNKNDFIPIALNGIKYQLAPVERKLVFIQDTYKWYDKEVEVEGGLDIQRIDGTNATITLPEEPAWSTILYVWD
ncbi:F-box associated domain-containing protein [Caenorhabditis elegans]|uniref:F-box associated domain-containing protein n=1 Tax=Caenorhabditis elegans TaxID=6239 RepID=P90944_CAEEL|nr:F-box associated domain-containing protein [Caenorhabditis elegans]CAB03232.2 F-box associated domain-containing protein [Caenorhabditis elegans]|eukprot:NP_502100.2 F-box B protein [Caenorhabditis elegans]